MKRFTLTGKSRHGKNRLREIARKHAGFTGVWREMQRKDAVLFAPGKRGPWIRIRPIMSRGDHIMSEAENDRWVHLGDDPDFTVTPAND